MKKHFTLIGMFLLVGASLIGGYLGRQVSADSKQGDAQDRMFRKYGAVLSAIEQNAADIPNEAEVIYSSIREMLQQLDPHSSFFSPKEYKDLEEENSGHYFGLGIRIRALIRGSGRIVIIEPPFPGTPAARVGLQAGDVIFKVNNQSIDEWDVDDVIDHLKGPKGTKVHITVLRPGEDDPLEMDVMRDEISKLTVNYAYRIRPGVGYIKVEHFSENTHTELEAAMAKLGVDSLEGLILDLRDNPGGYLSQAIKISEEYLPKGAPILSTKGRDGRDEQKYFTQEQGNLTVPIVVLINSSSASASEIVSGAIQDNDRGLIVGERSFGKGLVQSVYRLADGSGLALTTGKYYTPSGRCVQRPYNGSIYDYYNTRLRKALQYSESDLRSTLSGRKVYGGGGIQPDILYEARKLNHFELMLYSRDVFFKFATQARNGKFNSIPSMSDSEKERFRQFEVTEAVLADFQEFLDSQKISATEADVRENLEFVKRGIKAEVLTCLFGILDGFKIRAEGDDQIKKAIESLPQARTMLIKTKELLVELQERKEKGGL